MPRLRKNPASSILLSKKKTMWCSCFRNFSEVPGSSRSSVKNLKSISTDSRNSSKPQTDWHVLLWSSTPTPDLLLGRRLATQNTGSSDRNSVYVVVIKTYEVDMDHDGVKNHFSRVTFINYQQHIWVTCFIVLNLCAGLKYCLQDAKTANSCERVKQQKNSLFFQWFLTEAVKISP